MVLRGLYVPEQRMTFGGHLEQGSIVKGVLECFITEILGIENIPPVERVWEDDVYPENWYRSVK